MVDLPPEDSLDEDLLDRYLAGEGSEEENAQVRRYLMVHPEIARAIDTMLAGLDGEADRPPVPDATASLAALRARIEKGGPSLAAPPRVAGAYRRPSFTAIDLRPWWRRSANIAASVLITVGAAGAMWEATRQPAPVPAAAPESRTYATNNGERADIRLPDGTRIRLAPATRLRIAAEFGDERRDVYLVGEAYFDVTHDDERPFTVFAGNASARDLGTAFGVRSYSDDGAVQVIVREGAVALSGVGRLEEGDLGRLTAEGNATLRHNVNVDSLLGWLDSRLSFVDTPLDAVLRDIRRWHDVDVLLSDPGLGRLPFTGVLTDASADDAVTLVAATLGLRVRHREGRVMLTPVAGRTPGAP